LDFDPDASFRAAHREPLLKGELRTVDATIKAWRKRIHELIREMLVVERGRQLDDVERCTDTGVPGNFIEAYSPILQWMRGPRLKSAAAARDEVIAEFAGDAGELASEILRLRTSMRQAADALTQARAQGYVFHPR
jgi:hypothetical protein